MRKSRRGFTLVEVMIVVAIIGVLAAIAVYGVGRYLSAAKASEAKHMIGEISRSAHSAFERETKESEGLNDSQYSLAVAHNLCDTAQPVPAAGAPPGVKYQPITSNNADFYTGDELTGWKCLKFSTDHPVLYQYQYTRGSSPVAPGNPASCNTGECYEAGALGDLNNNGIFSRLARTGAVNLGTGALKASTYVYVENEAE